MLARNFVSFVALFAALLPQASSSSDDAQQKSAPTGAHDFNLPTSFVEMASFAEMASSKKRAALRRIEQLVPYKDNGQAANTIMNKESLVALGAGVTGASYKQHLSDFVASSGGTRYVNDPGNAKSAKYLKDKLIGMGYEVKELPWEDSFKRTSKANIAAVVAFKKGKDMSHESVVFGAHFDSVNWRDNNAPGKGAPGVDDNGSGTASLLAVAESLKDHEPRRNVLLTAFNAEEEGLVGSKSFVESVVNKKKHPEYGTIKGALILDEVAFPGRKKYTNQAIFETRGTVPGSMGIVDTIAHQLDDASGRVDSPMVNWEGFASDHISFLNAKIPALLLIERDDEYHADKVGHSEEDTFGDLSMDYGASMSRLALRTYATLLNPKDASEGSAQPPANHLRFKPKLDAKALKFQEAQLHQKYGASV